MKRILALLSAALLCAAVLAACGESKPEADLPTSAATASPVDSTEAAKPAGVVTGFYDTGTFSIPVPEGWQVFEQIDVFSDDDAVDPTALIICKGGVEEIDLLSKPYILINYDAPGDELRDPSYAKGNYDDVADMDDQIIGSRTWHAYSCVSYGCGYYILWTVGDGGGQLRLSVLYDNADGSIRLEDSDVQAIIAGVSITAVNE